MSSCIKATRTDSAEIVAFIDKVFTEAHRPHDFAALIPKVYGGDDVTKNAVHYLVKENGTVKAVAANLRMTLATQQHTLQTGFIGSVSVSPDSRGNGYMQELLHCAIDEAKRDGLDLLALGGQRQRYGYFGFEPAGAHFNFRITQSNIRHCLADVDCSQISFRDLEQNDTETIDALRSIYETLPLHAVRPPECFADILHTWNAPCKAVLKNGSLLGYCYGIFSEVILRDEAEFAAVLKAYFTQMGKTEVTLPVAPFETQRIAFLNRICEEAYIKPAEQICVLHWQRVLQTFLSLKATYTPLQDGAAVFCINGTCYRICVTDGVPTVAETAPDTAALTLTQNEAELLFFGIQSCLRPNDLLKNWAPLPFVIGIPDAF